MTTITPTVYEPTVTGLPPLRPYVRALWDRRPLIWHMARTGLKGEHYASVLGQLWILLDPLLNAAVYYMLRSIIRPIGSPAERDLLLSHLLWAIFFFFYTSKSLGAGARSLLANRVMILNTAFPRAVFPVVAIIRGFLDFVPTLLIYLFLFHPLLGQPYGAPLVLLPLMIFLLTIFNFGCVLFFAPLSVFFRDTTSFIPYITRMWLYASPILFTVAEMPANLKVILRWNPLYPFFAALEQIFVAQWPSTIYLVASAAWAVAAFLVGALFFLLREREFATRF